MDKENLKQELIDRVIEQIKIDINGQDETAIDGLLTLVPVEHLINFLSEEEWEKFESLKN